MSILIKDMEMPERCLECPFYDNYNYYCTLYSFGIPARYNRDGNTRPEWCELEELPKCEDAVSRKDVIELIKNSYYNIADSMEDTWAMVEDAEKLPSVTPKPRTGKWVKVMEGNAYRDRCSQCSDVYPNAHGYNYCPNCGYMIRWDSCRCLTGLPLVDAAERSKEE